MSARVEAGRAKECRPFGAARSRGAAVEYVGGDVRDFVAEGLEESVARPAAEASR